MNGVRMIARSVALSGILATAVSLTSFAGETKKPAASETPVVTDWSHSHLIFSQPRTPEQAARMQKDIRYQQQQARHTAHPEATLRTGEEESRLRLWRRHHRRWGGRRMHRDWSVDLGPGATVGAGRFPAKYSFSITTGSCGTVTPPAIPDFVVYGTGATTGSTTIAALTNLYASCGPPTPGDFWAYNTGGQVVTSPVLSLDGTQLAFTQTSGGTSSLVLLKWAPFSGLIASPIALTSTSPSLYAACATLPCMTVFPLGALDTNSSVYYDYGNDVAWVGDDTGKLHQFTGVFKGTAAEVTTGGWPAGVSTTALTSPVFDSATLTTFVGDKGGFLYHVDSTGIGTKSAQVDFGTGLIDSPMVDSSAGAVFVLSSDDNAGHAGMFQFGTNFGSGATATAQVALGTSSSTTPIYNGTPDQSYFLSPTATGNFYVCGDPGGKPTLYRVGITAAQLTSVLTGPVVGNTTTTACSPVTDIFNATLQGTGLPQEWVFLSVQGAGTPTQCGGVSCVMNFKVTSWQPNFVYNVGQEILDSNLNIQVVDHNGTSGTSAPVWNTSLFAPPTADGTSGLFWRNQGPLSGPTPPTWSANTFYNEAFEIVDSNNNIELESFLGGGTSGTVEPVWPTTEGATIVDNGVTWYNLGKNPVAALQAPGGTSGIIMDNTVINPSGSQVYYSTLQDSTCFTSNGVGGCAVQASQQDLN